MKQSKFVPIPRDQLPRDDAKNTHRGWKFKTLEHDQFNAPHAIEVTDSKGRSAVYVLLEQDGEVGHRIYRA